MKTIILRTASNYLLPILLLFSIFILLRGHYLPGGGFVGGLIASIAFVLHAFANGLKDTKKLLKFHPGYLMPAGLALSFFRECCFIRYWCSGHKPYKREDGKLHLELLSLPTHCLLLWYCLPRSQV